MRECDLRKLTGRVLQAMVFPVFLAACGSEPGRPGAGTTSYLSQPGYPYAVAQAGAAYSQGVSPPPFGYSHMVPSASYQPAAQPQPPPVPVVMPVSGEPMFAASRAPWIHAASYILVDASSGTPIVSSNADTRRAVASTQKILTALVVLDAGNLDKPVRVMSSDVNVEPTRLGLKPGEVYTRRNLLYAFLIKSANDVANVLARDNAGSISAFAAKMNAKARSLGARSSNFRNPHGLTASGQYSTARDMARIAMTAYRNATIRDAVRRKHYTFRYASGRTVTLKNTNELLGSMPECNGMKTGYTAASGRCLISTAGRGGRAVILVQLGTKTQYIWDDGRTLMSWGLQRTRGSGLAME